MPARLEEKVRKLFSMIDVDDSKTIDREETLNFWSKGFAKINSKVWFEQVDKNNDGAIQLEEWLEFGEWFMNQDMMRMKYVLN